MSLNGEAIRKTVREARITHASGHAERNRVIPQAGDRVNVDGRGSVMPTLESKVEVRVRYSGLRREASSVRKASQRHAHPTAKREELCSTWATNVPNAVVLR